MSRSRRRLSLTAHFTAQAWRQEGFPNAELFDSRLGRALFLPAHALFGALAQKAPSLPWHEQFLFIRHYAYDSRIRHHEPRFVLELGAGLSARGLTMARSAPELTYVEADLPHVVAAKRRFLRDTSLPPNLHFVSLDMVEDPIVGRLPVQPADDARVFVVSEGVTDYLTHDDKRSAWGGVRDFLESVGGGTYLFDAYTRARLGKYPLSTAVGLKILSALSRRPFERQLFDDAEAVRDAIVACGFDSAALIDVEAHNTSAYHPPDDFRHFELVEARVG